ncbi:protein asteroid homolog 1-like [Lytechinus variegatus]|uniref:protein asteroid homolog 1-like n=1 Tax=Lytechinus variegatus TaxID=7654 RepID=UPI001BB1CF29|nr:protein asteroid homolog 1-like [Lytechinus variegatus]
MGIRGLTTLAENHSKKLFKDITLQDTKLVIDGFGLLWYLFSQIQHADRMSHGGEYELLRSKIQYFFMNLLKCNCTPYVVFDGSFDLDDKKHGTMLDRFKDKIRIAREVIRGGDGLLMPALSLCVMKQVLSELNVGFAFSQFEADREIAILANYWRCPVLGKDSDFLVMDIIGGYLPLTLLKWKTVQKSRRGKCFIVGHIYQVNAFCNFFHVKKELLPLFATLAGNDYVNPVSLNPFLSNQVYGKYSGSGNKRQTQLEHLLCWLSEQRSSATALKDVWKSLTNKKELEPSFEASMEMYRTRHDSSNLVHYFEGQGLPKDFRSMSQLCSVIGTPVWVAIAHQAGLFGNLLINVLSKGYCFSSIQVENPRQPSAWLPSEILFSVLSGIVLGRRLQGNDCKGVETCHVYIRNGDGFQRKKVSPLQLLEGYGKLPTLETIPSLPETDKQKLLFQVLAPNLTTHMDLVSFPVDFQLALLVMLYWMNSKHSHYNDLHINSLLVGWVYLYTQRQNRMCKDGGPSEVQGQCAYSAPSGDLKSECKIMYTNLSHHQGRLRKRKPDPVISHSFSQWQQCLVYGICFNELLQSPLPDCPDTSILFNGLLMHSLYMTLRDASGREPLHRWAVAMFFKDTPIASQLFVSMHEFLASNATKVGQKNSAKSSNGQQSKQSSRKSKSRQGQQQKGRQQQGATPKSSNQVGEDSDSDQDWGANNRFALLQ